MRRKSGCKRYERSAPVSGGNGDFLLQHNQPRLEHGNPTIISQERNLGGKFSFEPFGTQE
jgi:hypothetical protein